MRHLLLILASASVAGPALAQQQDPHAGHSMPTQTQPPEDPHAGHQMAAEPAPQPADTQAEHEKPALPVADPHAGHDMSAATTADPHAGHSPGPQAGPEPGPAPAGAHSGPRHAADAYWGTGMERARAILREEHGGMPAHKLLVERAEARFGKDRQSYLLDAQGWFGGDIDKLWLKAELEGEWGERPGHAEVQALWSHAIGPWFDVQAGLRFDPQPGPNRTHLVVGIQGLAPYWWEVDGALFLSAKGEVTARVEAEHDVRVTQKLILQPRAELMLSAQDIGELGIGAGLGEGSLGVRMRYQLSPLVAPFVGIEYERAFGATADLREAGGERRGGINLLAGIRWWF